MPALPADPSPSASTTEAGSVRKGSRVRSLCLLLILLPLAGCLAPQPLRLAGETVIDGEQLWQGRVVVAGRVIVTRSGSLTIAPGTRVEFVRIDGDGDGIGDGELLVEGSLVARGNAEAPIVFTSAEQTPARSDWKFLYLDFARHGELAHVISEYAYSGVQVHFCRASIEDSVFRHNVDGVRFSTVTLELEHNDIYDNSHGIRYEERRGQGRVHHNTIRDNDIGIFVVTRAEDRTLFEFNNLAGNRNYSVKMGNTQSGDVSFPRNWWGSRDEDEIARSFLDRRIDASLGRVLIPEPLAVPVAEAGRRNET